MACLVAVGAAHPRYFRVDIRLELEEIQMSPGTLSGVMDRLAGRTAVRTGKRGAAREGDIKVDASAIRVEMLIGDFPGRLQAQCGREQRQLIQTLALTRRLKNNSSLPQTPCRRSPCEQSVNVAGERKIACAGAIDKPAICRVIAATMECGEKAFKDRQDKYGY